MKRCIKQKLIVFLDFVERKLTHDSLLILAMPQSLVEEVMLERVRLDGGLGIVSHPLGLGASECPVGVFRQLAL